MLLWEVLMMSLDESQLYYIKKAIGRKAKVIAASIGREIGGGAGKAAISMRIIKLRISKELRLHFQIDRIADLQAEDYDNALEEIKNYRFLYCEKYFG
jgi:hypothetical protein